MNESWSNRDQTDEGGKTPDDEKGDTDVIHGEEMLVSQKETQKSSCYSILAMSLWDRHVFPESLHETSLVCPPSSSSSS